MNSLQAGLRNELLLMLYRRKTPVFFIVSALLPVLLAMSFHLLQPIAGLVSISRSFPIQMLEMYTLFIIPLFLFLSIADLFPQEMSARTLKLVLLRPISRFRVYMAKLLALGVAVFGICLVVAGVSFLCQAALASPDAGSPDLAGLLKAYFAGFVSMWALSSLFAFAAQFFRSSSGFLVFSILLYAAAKVIPFFVKGFSAFSLTAYTDWYVVWLNHSVSAGTLLTSSLFVISAMVLFFSLGYLMFDRKEV